MYNYCGQEYALAIFTLGPEFHAIISDTRSNQPNILASNTSSFWGHNQPNITILKEDFTGIFNSSDSNVVTTRRATVSSQLNIVQRVTVPETAAVIEAIIDWLYESKIPGEAEQLADIYKAASKYKLAALRSLIVGQIEQLKGNTAFIISMMKIALEQKNEDLIKIIVPIIKSDGLMRQSLEFQTQLSQYGLLLAEYFVKY